MNVTTLTRSTTRVEDRTTQTIDPPGPEPAVSALVAQAEAFAQVARDAHERLSSRQDAEDELRRRHNASGQ
jgi:hypothetical protein